MAKDDRAPVFFHPPGFFTEATEVLRTETANEEANAFWEIKPVRPFAYFLSIESATWCCWSIADELPMHPCAPWLEQDEQPLSGAHGGRSIMSIGGSHGF